MKETWKDIKGYEGKYQVSNHGRVKSMKIVYGKCKEKILKANNNKAGYFIVNLSKKGKIKSFRVHRLVAEAFIPNPENYPIINHKDENPGNNRVENLEWCTYKYNNNYGTAIERKTQTLKTTYETKKKEGISINPNDYIDNRKKVFQYDKKLNLIREWNSISETTIIGCDISAVSKCCKGRRKTHKNCIWSFEKI